MVHFISFSCVFAIKLLESWSRLAVNHGATACKPTPSGRTEKSVSSWHRPSKALSWQTAIESKRKLARTISVQNGKHHASTQHRMGAHGGSSSTAGRSNQMLPVLQQTMKTSFIVIEKSFGMKAWLQNGERYQVRIWNSFET